MKSFHIENIQIPNLHMFIPGKDGITVMAVLAMCDMEPEIFSVNIFITQGAYFADAKVGGIHQSGHGLLL